MWTVPATRTKAKREHRVPLSRRAEQILDAARTRRRQPARVPERARQAVDRRGAVGVAVMVTRDRRHAVMIPVSPDHSAPAATSPVQTNTPSSVMMQIAAATAP